MKHSHSPGPSRTRQTLVTAHGCQDDQVLSRPDQIFLIPHSGLRQFCFLTKPSPLQRGGGDHAGGCPRSFSTNKTHPLQRPDHDVARGRQTSLSTPLPERKTLKVVWEPFSPCWTKPAVCLSSPMLHGYCQKKKSKFLHSCWK